jgi:hypothetical protein
MGRGAASGISTGKSPDRLWVVPRVEKSNRGMAKAWGAVMKLSGIRDGMESVVAVSDGSVTAGVGAGVSGADSTVATGAVVVVFAEAMAVPSWAARGSEHRIPPARVRAKLANLKDMEPRGDKRDWTITEKCYS